ncbi:MAG: hypothetical protein ABI823_15100, partial [Bryobacteraceae bacterium]
MILPFALLLASGCAQSDPCRTVETYLRALKALDADRIEALIDPSFRSKRDDGSDAPFNYAGSRANREFERGTRTKWTYKIVGVDGERIMVLLTEDNEYYRLLGVGVRTQITAYAARNGKVYFAEGKVMVDEQGSYSLAKRAFLDWLKGQPGAAADAGVNLSGDLVFNAASAPKLLRWLRKYNSIRK